MSTSETIDWQAEQDRFMRVAYERTVAAAHPPSASGTAASGMMRWPR